MHPAEDHLNFRPDTFRQAGQSLAIEETGSGAGKTDKGWVLGAQIGTDPCIGVGVCVTVDNIIAVTIGTQVSGNGGKTQRRHDVGHTRDIAIGAFGAVAEGMNKKNGCSVLLHGRYLGERLQRFSRRKLVFLYRLPPKTVAPLVVKFTQPVGGVKLDSAFDIGQQLHSIALGCHLPEGVEDGVGKV